jgi:hypothetical protein
MIRKLGAGIVKMGAKTLSGVISRYASSVDVTKLAIVHSEQLQNLSKGVSVRFYIIPANCGAL